MRAKQKLINILSSAEEITEQGEKYVLFLFICLACAYLLFTGKLK